MSYLWLSFVAASLAHAAALAPGAAVVTVPSLAVCMERAAAEAPDPSPMAKALLLLKGDPAPPKLTNDRHYLTSNERRIDLFEKDIRDKGGVYLGVGAGQNYTLAGWAKPELMVLVDFDEDVVDLHGVYALFFAYASTPEQFAKLWTVEGRKTALEVIDLGEFSRARRARLKALYKRARTYVEKRHEIMFAKLERHKKAWYLDDADQYDHVAGLVRDGQVVTHRGDFTKRGVMLAIGETLTERKAKLGTVYLSNIEMYFMYGKAYKANMLGLPLDAGTKVLRTLPVAPAGWEYMVQAGDNFHTWVGHAHTWSVYTIRGREKGVALHANALITLKDQPPRKRKPKPKPKPKTTTPAPAPG